jgi:putative membrane protein
MVAWFAGLFYMPRLFVYHCETTDEAGLLRFEKMERRLFFVITLPASLIVLASGLGMIWFYGRAYFNVSTWLHSKLLFVLALFVFQFFCWKWMRDFRLRRNTHSAKFFRIINEAPTVALVAIIYLVVFRP